MINRRVVLPIILLFTFGYFSIACGQGFSSLIEKLDQLEKRLDVIENQVSSQPQSTDDLVRLESKITGLEKSTDSRLANLKAQFNSGTDNANTEFIENSIVELNAKLTSLEQRMSTNGGHHVDGINAQLLSDISAMTEELKIAIESGPGESESDLGLNISGFVDASYFYDLPSQDNTFGFDQTEINIEKSVGEEGSIRVDLEWVNDGSGGFDLDAEQGYVTYSPLALKTTGFTFGKFNAPIGYELLDPHDMFQYSHALVFDYGLPTNLTGLMVNTEVESGIDLAAYVTNGWDENFDFNQGKTIGGRLGYAPVNTWAVGISAITGDQDESIDETTTYEHKLTVIDADLTITPNEKLIIGGEYNQGTDKVGDTTAKWSGFMGMFHYDYNDILGFTFRYDYFDDKDGTRFGSGVVEKRTALTFCPTFSLGNGMGALVEYRIDTSDQEVFTDKDGQPSKNSSNIAFEMTFTF